MMRHHTIFKHWKNKANSETSYCESWLYSHLIDYHREDSMDLVLKLKKWEYSNSDF